MASKSNRQKIERHDWLWGSLLLLAVIIVYSPVCWAGYIWDDNVYVTANPVVAGPLGLKEIWTTKAADICPLTITSFWLEHALWGLNPLPYHLVNVLLHGLSAIVLWRVLLNLKIPGAFFGAALWALHPVLVESVAWITELKNTQSTFFYLLSILFFTKSLQDSTPKSGGHWNYILTLLFAALAIASKSSTVILPLVLLLCAWWIKRRWDWRTLLQVGPIFLLSFAATVLSMLTEKLNDPHWARSWPERLITAGEAPWFYLGKLLWPHPLMMIYPRWQIDSGQMLSYLPLVGAAIVLLVFWLNRETWARPWFFAYAYFLVALLPVLGLVDHGFTRYSFVADHFQYLACIGPLALAAAGMVRLAHGLIPDRRCLQSTLGTVLLLLLGLFSWQRAWVFQDEESLWTDNLAHNPTCWVGDNNLGKILAQREQWDQAVALFQKAMANNPYYADPHSNFGVALAVHGQLDQAIAQFQTALEIEPTYVDASTNLGNALRDKGRIDDAIVQYQASLEAAPYVPEAHNGLGLALLKKGKLEDAIAQFQQAIQLRPGYLQARENLAQAQALLQQQAGQK